MDDYFYWISFSFNALSFIPYILILIAYYKRRDSFNQTMKINIHFCIICFLLNTSYLFPIYKNGWCELQGSLYVTSYVIAFLFNLLISFLFFMKTIYPNVVEKRQSIFYLGFPLLFWVLFLGLFLYQVLECSFYKNVIGFCRLKKDQVIYLSLLVLSFISAGLSVLLIVIMIIYIIKMAGEEKVSQYFRKIITVAVLQLFCVLLVAITRILEKNSLPESFFKIIDIFQCMLWPFLICLFS